MRRIMLIGLALTAGLIFLCAVESYAHGVGYRQSDLKSIALEFFYSTGEKMSYREARVKVCCTDRQDGRTGTFCVHPRYFRRVAGDCPR